MNSDQKKLNDSLQAFSWTRRISSMMGLWPIAPNYYLFLFHIIYFSCGLISQLTDLYGSVDNTDELIDNFTENLASSLAYIRVVMLGVHNYKIGKLIRLVFEDFNASIFKNSYEVKVFVAFVNKGKFILKGLSIFIISSEFGYYLDPLLSSLSGNPIDENNQTEFILPYTLYLPWEVNTPISYYLTYLTFGPLVFFMALGGSTVDCILISLVFSIAGKLAVLTMRINGLKNGPNCRKELSEIIAEHGKLLKMGATIRDVNRIGLLVYLVNIQFIIGVVGYQVLICYINGRESEALKYIFYAVEMYLMLVIYSNISECLMEESLNCCQAFYQCQWYNFPIDCSKDIIYCIGRSQKPLGLDAGKFTTYSMIILTTITKTAVGYISLLRSFLIRE